MWIAEIWSQGRLSRRLFEHKLQAGQSGFKKAYKVPSLEQVKDLLAGMVEATPQTALTVFQDKIRCSLAELRGKGELEPILKNTPLMKSLRLKS